MQSLNVNMFQQCYAGAVTRIQSNPLPCSLLQ